VSGVRARTGAVEPELAELDPANLSRQRLRQPSPCALPCSSASRGRPSGVPSATSSVARPAP